MSRRFTGKVAVVTGSSNGIGRATAFLFAKEGAQVTITGRNAERLEETRQQILKAGIPAGNVNSVVADLTFEAGQNDIIGSTVAKFGKIDILVNNAGGLIPDKTGSMGVDQGMDIYDATLTLNLRSVVEMTKKVVPYLTQSRGEIINVSSFASGLRSSPDFSYYSIAKAAVDQYTRNTAVSLIEHGIRVNSVSPGMVETNGTEAVGIPKEVAKKIINLMSSTKSCIPAGFVAQPDQIAESIAFLADRKVSSYVIGHQLVVDGGSTLVMGMHAQDFKELLKP